MLTEYAFWLLSFIAIFSGIATIISKNPVYSVLYLILTFFSIAGHYFLMNAQFLAAVHIIVYAGAIMVLFLYVIMMLNLNQLEIEKRSNILKMLAVASAGLLLVILSGAAHSADALTANPNKVTPAGMVEDLGIALYRNYLLPFELASILFLAAMVGAVYLSKKNLNETQA